MRQREVSFPGAAYRCNEPFQQGAGGGPLLSTLALGQCKTEEAEALTLEVAGPPITVGALAAESGGLLPPPTRDRLGRRDLQGDRRSGGTLLVGCEGHPRNLIAEFPDRSVVESRRGNRDTGERFRRSARAGVSHQGIRGPEVGRPPTLFLSDLPLRRTKGFHC